MIELAVAIKQGVPGRPAHPRSRWEEQGGRDQEPQSCTRSPALGLSAQPSPKRGGRPAGCPLSRPVRIGSLAPFSLSLSDFFSPESPRKQLGSPFAPASYLSSLSRSLAPSLFLRPISSHSLTSIVPTACFILMSRHRSPSTLTSAQLLYIALQIPLIPSALAPSYPMASPFASLLSHLALSLYPYSSPSPRLPSCIVSAFRHREQACSIPPPSRSRSITPASDVLMEGKDPSGAPPRRDARPT